MVDIVPAAAWRRQRWGMLRSMPLPRPGVWVHHGASGAPTLATLRAYERHHVVNRGWAALGYSFAIVGDGTVYEARGWGRVGAHTQGSNTDHGICLVGDFSRQVPPEPMVRALAELVLHGVKVGAITRPAITGGHREAPGAATSCPGAGGMQAIAAARTLLDRHRPPTSQEADMTPAQEAKLDQALARLDQVERRVAELRDDTIDVHLRPLRRSVRAIERHHGLEVEGGA